MVSSFSAARPGRVMREGETTSEVSRSSPLSRMRSTLAVMASMKVVDSGVAVKRMRERTRKLSPTPVRIRVFS